MTPAISVEKSGAISVPKSVVNSGAHETGRNTAVVAGQVASTPAALKSRLLKGSNALQSSRRPHSGEPTYSLVPHLTERDREIVRAVARFRVFTAEQLAEMFFDTLKRGQVRLHRLHQLGVLDRFQPYRAGWGSSPFHYVLGPLGVEMAAADGPHDVTAVRRRSNAAGLSLGRPADLARIRAANGVYAALVGDARRHSDAELLDWMTADEARQWSEGMVEAMAFGEWSEGGCSVEFFVEADRAGPIQRVVTDAADRRERFAAERGRTAAILFIASTRARARKARLVDAASAWAITALAGYQSTRRCWELAPYGVPEDVTVVLRHFLRHPPNPSASNEPRRAWLFERRRERGRSA